MNASLHCPSHQLLVGRFRLRVIVAVLSTFILTPAFGRAADTLRWNTNNHRVSASIESVPLLRLLEGIAQLTGWQVYVESNATHTVSVSFTDLPPGEALRMLLGSMSFAMVPPESGGRPRLYVFQSSQRNATHRVMPADLSHTPDELSSARAIADELVVSLKRGVKLADVACLRSAKVAGQLGTFSTYRLKFSSADEAKAARECLAGNPDVEVDSNFPMERPFPPQAVDQNAALDFGLKLKEASGDCRPVIALVDTGFGSLGAEFDTFVRPAISITGTKGTAPGLTHGSAMAETILRSLSAAGGGTTSAVLQPVDVYGQNATTTTFDVAQGIYEGVNAGANIVNLSLGSAGDSIVLHNIIKAASQQGVVFLGAAGNTPVTTPFYPAAYPEVLAVTAGDRDGQIASYANRGNFVDIMAPGTSIVSFNGNSYAVTGTSTAAAYAAGLAAAMADASQNCPSSVVSDLRGRLGVTANK